jgi:hypothetical protein
MNPQAHPVDSETASIETLGPAIDKYEIANFARDDFPRFMELVNLLSPRDAEIMLCFAVLQKRPTDLSILFGKAGHRAEEDLHKAAHKLAGLIEFGPAPSIETLNAILPTRLQSFSGHAFAACIWQYARCRDFSEVARLVGSHGLRQQMLRAFKALHSAEGREEGLLAGWILWLVDTSNPRGKGWRKRLRGNHRYKLGPTVFRTLNANVAKLVPRATGRGGRGQRPDTVKITRKIKFLMRGQVKSI